MYEPAKRTSILTLNIQINEYESECLEIFCLTELDAKTDRFCRTYQIQDLKTVSKLKQRIRESLKEKYPFLLIKEKNYKDTKRPNTKKVTSTKEIPGVRKITNKKITVETSVSKGGIHNLLYSKKGDNNFGKSSCTTKSKGYRAVKSFVETIKPRVFMNKKPQDDKENVEGSKKEIKNNFSERPQLNIDLSLSSIMIREPTVASVYNMTNPLLSYSYTNPTVLQQRVVPLTASNRSFLERATETDFDTKDRKFSCNSSQAKLTKKSSFYEYSSNQDKRNYLFDSQLKLRESSMNNNGIEDKTDSALNFDNYAFKIIPKDQLKLIFEQLDSNHSGLIGPKNLNLRSLSSEHLKILEGVVIEIFKRDKNTFFTLHDFCQLVKDHVKIE